jgi:hypothetical protein
MNSGWTKVAAFATGHMPNGQVIWDSRVAHSLIRRIDNILVNSGRQEIPEFLKGVGWVPGRGGTRHHPRTYKLKWPNGYRSWQAQFAGSSLVHAIRDELNKRQMGATSPQEPWSVRTVEMVLFMDGY